MHKYCNKKFHDGSWHPASLSPERLHTYAQRATRVSLAPRTFPMCRTLTLNRGARQLRFDAVVLLLLWLLLPALNSTALNYGHKFKRKKAS